MSGYVQRLSFVSGVAWPADLRDVQADNPPQIWGIAIMPARRF